MVKSKVATKEHEEDFDFFDELDSSGGEAMAGMLAGMIEASRNQQLTAIELTKLVVECSSNQKMKAEEVFTLFKQACHVANESTALKGLWEKLT